MDLVVVVAGDCQSDLSLMDLLVAGKPDAVGDILMQILKGREPGLPFLPRCDGCVLS